MESNNNIFYASNPANILSALWELIKDADLSNSVIFLPSRRAVRNVEKMLVEKNGSAMMLPLLVPLGEEAIDLDEDVTDTDIISNAQRFVLLLKLLSADPKIKNISTAIPVARDLLRCQDYLENEGIDSTQIDWINLVDEKYAKHFKDKAKFLDILTKVLPSIIENKMTSVAARNLGIKKWMDVLSNRDKIIVCGSTGSVPATADLMTYISKLNNGYIILPGKITGKTDELSQSTNPYNSEFKFLNKINFDINSVKEIDVGNSDIDFLNSAFSNSGVRFDIQTNQTLVAAENEGDEAQIVAQIAKRAILENKTVLVITPDAAGNQRIASVMQRYQIPCDFSGGVSGTQTNTGRAILNFIDDSFDDENFSLIDEYNKSQNNLFNTLLNCYESNPEKFVPVFDSQSDEAISIWQSIKNISDVLDEYELTLSANDIRAIVMDAISGVSIRGVLNDDARVKVLGTVESRMQTADIVVLTGLNEGMFPALGYENSWLPKSIVEKIGLPLPTRKVSLMALDFMTLSCGNEVYWLRSKTAGTTQTTPSRFLSRVMVAAKKIKTDEKLLQDVKNLDMVEHKPLNYDFPRPKAFRGNIFVTDLELLIHNPYAFYVRKMLRLSPIKDFWEQADPRDFGNIVHNVIENAIGKSEHQILQELEEGGKKALPKNSIIFYFWKKRFEKIANYIYHFFQNINEKIEFEIEGHCKIAGKNVFARADIIYDGVVIDVKTGAAPSVKQLNLGNYRWKHI